MKRKHILLSVAGLVSGLSLLVLSGCCTLPHATSKAQDTSQVVYHQTTEQTKNTQPETYPQNTSNNHHAQQESVRQISSKKAREIAVDFVGYGVAHDIMAFMEEGTLIFEVDIRYDAARYVVHLNAENGVVTSLNRHENEAAVASVATDPPDDTTTPDEQIAQTAPTPPAAPAPPSTPTPPAAPTPTPQPPASTSTGSRSSRPSNPAISLNRAIEIANADLASRGINATYRSNSGMDWERGQWVWELLYRTHGERMPLIEYYINVNNGSIVKFEWDD